MKKTIYLIILFSFIQGIIHNLGHPVTPAFVSGLGIPNYMFGVFFATMSFGLMIGAPIWGILADHGQKKKYILIGLLIYSLGQFLFGYSHYAVLMVIVRFLSGFGVISASTLMISHVIEISEMKDRARHLAYIAAAVTLGSSIGYFLGGFLATNELMRAWFGTIDLRRIFLIQALLNTLYVLFIFIAFKEEKHEVHLKRRPSVFQGFKEAAHIEPGLLIFLISLTFITVGATNLNKYMDVYFNELGFNPQQLGTFVMATGFVSLFASVLIVPLVARIKRMLSLIAIIQILSSVIVFYVFRAQQFLIAAYTVYMFYIIFKTIYQPLEQNYISLHAKEGKYGTVMGIRQSFVSIGMVIGPLLGGVLYEIKPLVMFDFSGIMFLIGAMLLIWVFQLEIKKQVNTRSSESLMESELL